MGIGENRYFLKTVGGESELEACSVGRIMDKGNRGGGGGTSFLRDTLGLGNAVSTSCLAIDWC